MKNLVLKKDFPFYSIIIPVYNVSKYIEGCLKSILDQSFKDFEIILVNDGSNDNSGEICNQYAIKNENVVVVHQVNSGTASARNAGMVIAKGKYLWFVDSDDLISENSLSELYQIVNKYKSISVLNFTKRDFKDNELIELSIHFPLTISEFVQNSENSPEGMPSNVCFTLYNREFLLDKDLKFEEDNVFEDEFFNLKLYANNSFDFLNINIPLYLYRRRNNNNKTSLSDSKSLYKKCISKIMLYKYTSEIIKNKSRNEFFYYKKRFYAEYGLFFFENYILSESHELKDRLINYFKKNISNIPIKGSYFKHSNFKRILYNFNINLFVGYIKLLSFISTKKQKNDAL